MELTQNTLEKIKVYYDNGKRKVRCFCGETHNHSIVSHIKRIHSKEWKKWSLEFVRLRNRGLSPSSIIKNFRTKDGKLLFTTSVVEKAIRRTIENKDAELRILSKPSVDEWEPSSFSLQRTTVWNFQKRGNWAVHQNDYRGNWAPSVPRNLILRYSLEGETILDPFVGGGTTLIEAWLNNRRSFGLDVSPTAIKTSQERIKEMENKTQKDGRKNLNQEFKPLLIRADARDAKEALSRHHVEDGSVKLACIHPPYLNSLRYTETIEEDLSRISDKDIFCDQIQLVASQIYDLVADKGTCAVLIGDIKRNNRVVPLGFLVKERFENEDFQLRDIIIKVQHADSSTRFWYTKRKKIDYLMAHEYLFIFSK